VARQPLDLARRLDQLRDLPFRLGPRAQLRGLLERLVERDAEALRHELRDAVDVAVGQPHHPPDVADRRARLELAEGDDLRDALALDPLAVVLAGDVADHLVAAPHAEVDVDVGHRHLLGIQEALEDDVVLDRIDAGDAEAVGDDAAGRGAPARPDRDPVAARVGDEVRDDQEVAGEAHRPDHAELVLHALRVLGEARRDRLVRVEAEARAQALPGLLAEHRLAGRTRRQLELRQVVAARVEVEVDLAALRDLEGVRERRGMVVEELRHLVAGLEVEAVPVETEAVRIVEVLAGADAQERVVVPVVPGGQVVGVVGREQRKLQVHRHLRELGVHAVLVADAVALQLEVEAVAEDPGEILGQPPGAVELSGADRAARHRGQAAGGRDQALVVLPQEVHVDARLVVEALEVGLRHEHHQVPVAGVVHREQQQVADRIEARGVALARLAFEARAGREVDLAAEDRLDAVLLGGLEELDRAEEVAVVGERDRRHAELLRALEERIDLDRAVEQRVLAVQVEVDEGPRAHAATPIRSSPEASTRCRRPPG
jgi:hypothetical protein